LKNFFHHHILSLTIHLLAHKHMMDNISKANSP
jgi:hypothetical protein